MNTGTNSLRIPLDVAIDTACILSGVEEFGFRTFQDIEAQAYLDEQTEESVVSMHMLKHLKPRSEEYDALFESLTPDQRAVAGEWARLPDISLMPLYERAWGCENRLAILSVFLADTPVLKEASVEEQIAKHIQDGTYIYTPIAFFLDNQVIANIHCHLDGSEWTTCVAQFEDLKESADPGIVNLEAELKGLGLRPPLGEPQGERADYERKRDYREIAPIIAKYLKPV